jgi:2,3-bisphosphoglycerate-independent phosphoglycerate mutase
VTTDKKIILIIMDGWGLAPAWGGNAIEMAQTTNIDALWRKFPHTQLGAAQEAVGLPVHEMGNSEVGHLNIGCGQIAFQNLTGISETITDGKFFTNPILLDACDNVKKNNSSLHILGLVSDGGIHSHIDHLYALLKLAHDQGIDNVYIHAITDGRDTDPMKAYIYLNNLKNKIAEIGVGQIVSIMGRYYAMDRDKHWDRIKKAYDCIVDGIAPISESPEKAIAENYRQNHTDEFIQPTIIQTKEKPFHGIKDNDSLIFFNFRADRARQITDAIIETKFKGFDRKKINNLRFVTFSFLEEYVNNSAIKPAFQLRDIKFPLARVLSEAGLSQYHIAETEKYAHVTFFFNGGKETLYPGEDHFLINSPKVPTFDLKPEMSAHEITEKVLHEYHKYDFTVLNFANADMVGHTGNIKAIIKACEVVDKCVNNIVMNALKNNTIVMITADHGNAEQKLDPITGETSTDHTTNRVPFILCANSTELQRPLRSTGGKFGLVLSDIAPTILDIFDVPKPDEMTGTSLIIKS